MRSLALGFGLALAVWVSVAGSLVAQDTEVTAAVTETLDAWKQGRFEEFAAFYHDDARGFFLDGGALMGGFNVATLQAAYDAGFRADLDLRDLDVRVIGEVAISVAYLVGKLTLPGGGALEGSWRYSETRLPVDGTWKVVQFHFSQQEGPGSG